MEAEEVRAFGRQSEVSRFASLHVLRLPVITERESNKYGEHTDAKKEKSEVKLTCL